MLGSGAGDTGQQKLGMLGSCKHLVQLAWVRRVGSRKMGLGRTTSRDGRETPPKPGGKQHCPCLGEGRLSQCSPSGVMGNTTSGSGMLSLSGMLATRCLTAPSEGTLPRWSSPRYQIQPSWVVGWSPVG